MALWVQVPRNPFEPLAGRKCSLGCGSADCGRSSGYLGQEADQVLVLQDGAVQDVLPMFRRDVAPRDRLVNIFCVVHLHGSSLVTFRNDGELPFGFPLNQPQKG